MSNRLIQQATTDRIQHDSRWEPTARAAQSADRSVLAQIDLATLAQLCAAQNERFRRGQFSDPSYAHELFRRALVERDQAAWEHLYNQYRGLMERWVRRQAAFGNSGECSNNLVGEAFARFWHAVPPERFDRFPNVAALLRYLQMCAGCVVIDHARTQATARVAAEKLFPLEEAHQHAPEEEVVEQMGREEFWRCVANRLHDEAERVVVFDSFVYGMKPSDICKSRRDLFVSVKDVYLVKRNVLDRLSRDQGLRGLLEQRL